jgi:transcriptional regulator with XRE-family HTH domain
MTSEEKVESTIRYWRLRRGYSQSELADSANVSIAVIRGLEQKGYHFEGPYGVRLGTLYALARALNVQTAQLFPPAIGPEPADKDPVRLALLPTRLALTPPLLAAPEDDTHEAVLEASALRRAVIQGARLYDRDQYDELAGQLPGLLRVARPIAPPSAGESAGIDTLRSAAFHLAAWFLTQLGAHDLAYQAVREGLAIAQACGDRLLAASCVMAECWLFIRQGRLLDAKRTAIATADLIEPKRLREADSKQFAVWGWLLVLAWAAAVRNNQEVEARELLRIAGSAGAPSEQGRINYEHYWPTLGSATIAMKEVEHEVIVGDYRKAIRLAEQVPLGRGVRADNLQRHMLALATAHAKTGDRAMATAILTKLRTTAPHWLRYQRAGRAIAGQLLVSPARSLPADIRTLADFYDLGGSLGKVLRRVILWGHAIAKY